MNRVATASVTLRRGKIIALGVASLLGSLIAQEKSQNPARDVISESNLRQMVMATPSLKSQLKIQAKPVTGAPPKMESSLWTKSIILSDGEKYTLVPVGSILHLPASLRSRVLAKPQGDFTFWPNFLKRNESWLGGREVTLGMSRGNRQAAKELLASVAHDQRLLVAIYKGGPITILEPAEEPSSEKKP